MKLIRFGRVGMEKPGIIGREGMWQDVCFFREDYFQQFFISNGLLRLEEWLKHNPCSCAIVNKTERFGSPLKNPSKIIYVGLNYGQDAGESGMELPAEPILFFKSTSAISGQFDKVVISRGSEKTDWEVVPAIVIGEKAIYIDDANPMEYIVGYVLLNEVSERACHLENGAQWVKGKSTDTFGPLDPFLSTRDKITDPDNLNILLNLNRVTMERSNSNDLIFSVALLVSYISNFMTLFPRDIISTGSPSGVGMGINPPRYLKSGDVMELSVEGLAYQYKRIWVLINRQA